MLNRAIFLSLMGALAALNLPAQDARATIGGRVSDFQGAAVPNAAIEVIAEDTAVRQTTVTNEQGNWTVQFLLPGRYRFSVSRPGFKTMIRDGLTLQAADIKQFDVVLGNPTCVLDKALGEHRPAATGAARLDDHVETGRLQ